MKVVLTGGPCTGKTTLIEGIRKRGYTVIPEVARRVIFERGLPESFKERQILQQAIMEEQERVEAQPHDGLVFQDRSLVDCIAYSSFHLNVDVGEFSGFNVRGRYSDVFLLDRLPFKNDSERNETPEQAAHIHNLINQLYLDNGYRVTQVPVLPVEDRIDFVLAKVSR